MEKYEIYLKSKNDKFEDDNDNIMKISVVDEHGQQIPSKKIWVELSLSKNAMLGLGTELIRRAIQDKYKDKHWHLDPTVRGDVNNASQEMGVFLHPDSPELIILQNEFGDIFKVLK